MTVASLSLQQLQAYRRRPGDDRWPEILCTTFLLSQIVELNALRQAADDTLAHASIPMPESVGETACMVTASDERTWSDACSRAVDNLLDRGGICRLELAQTDDGVWLVAVSVSWLFDADGLGGFAARVLEHAVHVVPCDEFKHARYSDYMHWQREIAASPEAKFGQQYWTRRAANFQPLGTLQLEERLDPLAPAAARCAVRQLCPNVKEWLRTSAERYRVRWDALVLATWLIVLERLRPEQRKDLVVAVSHRDDQFVGDITGRLALELPLSFPMVGHSPFASLVKRVDEQLEEADEWKECFTAQYLPIDAERSAPRFSTRTLRQGSADAVTWCEYAAPTFNPTSRIEMIFVRGPRPTLLLSGDPSCYGDLTLNFLLREYETVLTCALNDALTSVDSLIAVNATESEDDWNTPVEGTQNAIELASTRIDSALKYYRERTAIRYGDRTITYAELGRRIESRSHVFAESGLGLEDTVALYIDDPVEYIVSALAAWRVGANFVAVDAQLPSTRVEKLVTRTGARAVVNANGTTRILGAACKDMQAGRAHLEQRLHREALAYVIFTSGTSGEPRSIAVAHRALANQLTALSSRMPIAPKEAALVRTPGTFDASLWEWLHPLASGATLHILNVDDSFSEPAILDVLRKQPIAMAQMTPSLLRRCLRAGGANALAKTEHLVIGGEPFDAELVAPVERRGGVLVNAYGPAETCVNASVHRVTSDRHLRTVPIGDPLNGYALYIVDSALRPLATGRIGELCIGGEGLARCLVGDAAETAAVFLPDPFAVEAGARMYATGDLVRRLPNGEIEFVRRADEQLKIGGVRIDEHEVVAAMKDVRSVKDAALVMLYEPSQALIAFVVPTSTNHFSADALRTALRARLPSSMCPAQFVALDALPLDQHGKIDRHALRDLATTESEVMYVAPRTESEQRVAECWRSVLNVDRVGVHDNFFLVGGHSLSFGRLIVALREEFGINLPLSRLIAAPSVSALARYIDECRNSDGGNAHAR